MENNRKGLTAVLAIIFYILFFVIVKSTAGSDNALLVIVLFLGVGGFLFARERLRNGSRALKGGIEGARRASGNDFEGTVSRGLFYAVGSFFLGLFVAPYQYAKMVARLLPAKTVDGIRDRVSGAVQRQNAPDTRTDARPPQQPVQTQPKPQPVRQAQPAQTAQPVTRSQSRSYTPQQAEKEQAEKEARWARMREEARERQARANGQTSQTAKPQLTSQQQAHIQSLKSRYASAPKQETETQAEKEARWARMREEARQRQAGSFDRRSYGSSGSGSRTAKLLVNAGRDSLTNIQEKKRAIGDPQLSAILDRVVRKGDQILTTLSNIPEYAPKVKQYVTFYLPMLERLLHNYERIVKSNADDSVKQDERSVMLENANMILTVSEEVLSSLD